eukprot:TRINITY_DN2889_c0_g1_i3.p1 TRINITY_DN2889_c0_g1~~TRINITY_DN2889_c0_g1_i3.p1  ORF type:complete len:456 (+),score=197.28 TRINITY_DN2889_c0_g1_i3:49-1416(+)
MAAATDERWEEIQRVCWREPGIASPDWDESLKEQDWGDLRLLVIGAGGLGCEILKDLALVGFRNIDVIDMDTVDLSNLNRQFLFREKDVGQPKANVASSFVMSRVPGCQITPHYGRIEDKENDFYRQFACIVLGLDSVQARMWINAKVCELTEWGYSEGDPSSGEVTVLSSIPMVDGGTEGFKGHARVINIGQTACIESTSWMFPPQVTFPMCTLENVPRLPEHCVEYVKVKTWEDDRPFGVLPNGNAAPVDGDDPDHIMWIAQKAQERGAAHGIDGITYAFTQGVVKNITPAIASTNAIIAASCCHEVLKMATGAAPTLQNYFMYNGNSIDNGVYGQIQELGPDPTCDVSKPPQIMKVGRATTPRQFVESLLLGSEDVVNGSFEMYTDAAQLTLQSPVAGVLLAPKGSVIAREVATPLGELNLDDGGDTAPLLIATDPSFWGRAQFKVLLQFID